jgi:Ni,Fe-hydrogenase III small subunit
MKSLYVYHLHMGGPDADALEWRGLMASRYAQKLRQMGVASVGSAREADIVVVTGLLTARNLDAVLTELSGMPARSLIIAAGDLATGGGLWADAIGMPGVWRQHLGHYVEIGVSVAGNPPTPQALIAALAAAADKLG